MILYYYAIYPFEKITIFLFCGLKIKNKLEGFTFILQFFWNFSAI